jgi:hypothetical protein
MMDDETKVIIAVVVVFIYTMAVSVISYNNGESATTIKCYEEKLEQSK